MSTEAIVCCIGGGNFLLLPNWYMVHCNGEKMA